MNKPLVTIVFPMYNRKDEVTWSLNYFRTTLKIDYEVIILDNSPKITSFKLNNNEHYYHTGGNLGTYARNIGIEKASAPYILMLDDDSHPLPNSLESAIILLRNSQKKIAGITSQVKLLNGDKEGTPLLPTIFHGCGSLFKTNIIQNIKLYPDNFCFYGEEYWSTLLIYSLGYELLYSEKFQVCHRMSSAGRDKSKILYYLTRNNRLTWSEFIPEKYLNQVISDTTRRYELICEKESISQAFEKGINEKLIDVTNTHKLMSLPQFEKFALLDKFKHIINKIDCTKTVILCGCGKFPSLWADFIKNKTFCDIRIADFNLGIINQKYGNYTILSSKDVIELKENSQFIIGHSSRLDSERWQNLLDSLNIQAIFLC